MFLNNIQNDYHQVMGCIVYFLSIWTRQYKCFTDVSRREQMDNSPEGGEEEGRTNGTLPPSATLNRKSSAGTVRNKRQSKIKLSGSKLNFGDATDDVHVCIMCLRAIMNHQVK